MGIIHITDQDTAIRLRSSMADLQTGLIESVAGIDRMMASLAAQRAMLVDRAHEWAQVTVDQVVPVGAPPLRRKELAERSFVAEIACALRMPERSAQKLIAESTVLVRDLPASFTALAEGRIGYRHAQVLVDEAYGLPAEGRRELETAVIDKAGQSTPSRLRATVRRVRERMHPESMKARARVAVAGRSVTVEPARDGMAWLNLYVQAPLVAGIDDRLGQVAAAMKQQGDPRTTTQLRADVAAMLLLGDGAGICGADVDVTAERCEDGHDAMGPLARLLELVRLEMNVTVPVLTMLGRSEEPGTLDGTIPIDADTARVLAGAAPSFTRLLTNPETGVVLSVGREKYRPPPDMARWLRLRDGVCRFPGCRRRARRTEIDHTGQWQSDGLTRWDNLACLCVKHHHLKDETAWSVVHRPGGILSWTSPAGRAYTTYPELELPAPDLRGLEPSAPLDVSMPDLPTAGRDATNAAF